MYHLYADDTHQYLAFSPSDLRSINAIIDKTETVLCAIKTWMADNWLSLNGDKTEFLVITTRQQCLDLTNMSLRIGSTTVVPNKKVKKSWCDI